MFVWLLEKKNEDGIWEPAFLHSCWFYPSKRKALKARTENIAEHNRKRFRPKRYVSASLLS